jgi:ATP-dependent helicase/nuclease subunit B
MIELHQQVWLTLNPEVEAQYAQLLEQNLQLVSDDIICAKSEYLSILQQQCATIRHVPLPINAHVTIIGALELRLQVADFLIVPRMNEGVFPSAPPPDPWLNNELRRMLGLNYFERKIGLSAHDMAIMLRFEHVLFIRALKEKGAHTRSSRLFERLKLLLQKNNMPPATYLLNWLQELNYVKHNPSIAPIIIPPIAMRPRKISATMCEAFFENPFKVYATNILKLRELEPLDDELQPKHFGQILHAALHEAAKDYNTQYYLQKLETLFEEQLKTLVPAAQAQFYHAKLQRILQAYFYEENLRKSSIARLETEVKYAIAFVLDDGIIVELNARIDRIEHLAIGKINIIDHKTGAIPDAKQVASFEKCQLLVTKLIMQNVAKVEALEYWDASGKRSQQTSISQSINAPSNAEIAAKLYDCLSYFICNPEAIYAYVVSNNQKKATAIDHLARLGEYY